MCNIFFMKQEGEEYLYVKSYFLMVMYYKEKKKGKKKEKKKGLNNCN